MKKHFILSMPFSFLLIIMWFIPDTAVAQQLTKKWFPGHYVAIRFGDRSVNQDTRDLVKNNPYITGYKTHIVWKELEPVKDQYDFTIIREMIKIAESDGKKLMIHIQDRLFGQNANPYLPNYILTSEYEGGWYSNGSAAGSKNSYPRVWLASYQVRWNKLLRAIGEEIDNNQTVAGFIVSESAMNVKGIDTYDKPGHLNFITSMHTTMATYAPNTIFFQYVNWGFTAADRDMIMKHVVEVSRSGFGGPDIFDGLDLVNNKSWTLQMAFASFYDKYRGIAPISVENQAGGYSATGGAQQIFDYAVDKVGVHFLPWSNRTGKVFNFKDDVLPLINKEKGRINTTPPSNIISTGISTNQSKSGKYSIYPNPVNDMVKLSLNYDYPDGSNTCHLLDISGKVLDTKVIINPSSIISTSQLVKGTYFLRITDNNLNTETLKFIKI